MSEQPMTSEERVAALGGVAPRDEDRPPGWVTVLPISSSAARERAKQLREVRAKRLPGGR